MAVKNYYQILGVDPAADLTTIKKAHRALVLELHPDRTGGDKAKEEAFKNVSEAWDVLGDTAKRAQYDRLNSVNRENGRGVSSAGNQDFSQSSGRERNDRGAASTTRPESVSGRENRWSKATKSAVDDFFRKQNVRGHDEYASGTKSEIKTSTTGERMSTDQARVDREHRERAQNMIREEQVRREKLVREEQERRERMQQMERDRRERTAQAERERQERVKETERARIERIEQAGRDRRESIARAERERLERLDRLGRRGK